jgi:hypothetical protein
MINISENKHQCVPHVWVPNVFQNLYLVAIFKVLVLIIIYLFICYKGANSTGKKPIIGIVQIHY